MMCAHGAEDVRKYAAQQGLTEEDAVKRGLQEKAAEFVEKGGKMYAKT
jgi:phosphomethylpyrimidine synthase